MNLTDWFNDTINVASADGTKDNYGARGYAAYRAVDARVEQTDKIVKDQNGNELQAKYWISTAEVMHWTDRIWVPGENPVTDEPHTVIQLKTARLKRATDWRHYEVML
jgi:hypothetical protein